MCTWIDVHFYDMDTSMEQLTAESLFHDVTEISLERWRSNPFVNMENDMARITIDIPVIQGIMLSNLIKPYIIKDSKI